MEDRANTLIKEKCNQLKLINMKQLKSLKEFEGSLNILNSYALKFQGL